MGECVGRRGSIYLLLSLSDPGLSVSFILWSRSLSDPGLYLTLCFRPLFLTDSDLSLLSRSTISLSHIHIHTTFLPQNKAKSCPGVLLFQFSPCLIIYRSLPWASESDITCINLSPTKPLWGADCSLRFSCCLLDVRDYWPNRMKWKKIKLM